MPDQSSPDQSTQPASTAAASAPATDPAPSAVPFSLVWATADGTQQSALAGLIADQPELHEAENTPAEWQALLDKYLQSPRP